MRAKGSPGKNRSRFYSHQIDEEHFKAFNQLKEVKEDGSEESDGKEDSQKSSNSQKVCKDPTDLLKGISDMFVNSEMGVNYSKSNEEGKHS